MLTAGRNVYALIFERLDISSDGAQATAEDIISQIFLRKVNALVKSFLGDAQDFSAPQCWDAIAKKDLLVFFAGIKGDNT